MTTICEDEFWWLSVEQRNSFSYICPSYQDELPNDRLSKLKHGSRIRIGDLSGWCEARHWVNVHRGIALYSRPSGQSETLDDPFLLDFDNSDEDLVSACTCTRESLKFLIRELAIDPLKDCRVFFSGRKGFHIELRPMALDSKSLVDRRGRPSFHWDLINHVSRACGFNKGNTNQLDRTGTVLDKLHDRKRINGSINAWWHNGRTYRRMMIEVRSETLLTGNSAALVPVLVRKSEAIGA